MKRVGGATIRRATVDDAYEIAEVHVASWRWAYEGLLPDAVLDALSVEERATGWAPILEQAPEGVLVAVDEVGRVAGFSSVGPTRDDDAPSGTGELFAIYLRPEAAGTGLGSVLLGGAEEDLRGAGFRRGTLWVLETNARARSFYERHGWTWDGARSEHRFDCDHRPIVRYARNLVPAVA